MLCELCGHFSCIVKWLKGKKGKCPQCNEKAARNDIRPIYIPGRTLQVSDLFVPCLCRVLGKTGTLTTFWNVSIPQVIDTTERDAALKELEREREERRKAELAAAEARLRFHMAVDECNRMKQECEKQKQQMALLRFVGLFTTSPKNCWSCWWRTSVQATKICRCFLVVYQNWSPTEIRSCETKGRKTKEELLLGDME